MCKGRGCVEGGGGCTVEDKAPFVEGRVEYEPRQPSCQAGAGGTAGLGGLGGGVGGPGWGE